MVTTPSLYLTGCNREGIPLDEGRSPGDATQRENGDHIERISLLTFLSLILWMRLLKRMKDTGLLKHYTLEGLLPELAKIKRRFGWQTASHHDGVHEKATDEPETPGGMRLTHGKSEIKVFFVQNMLINCTGVEIMM